MRVLKPIPKDKPIDSTMGFLRDGYLFISKRMKENQTEVFSARFFGKKIFFLMGKEAAQLFYNEEFFKRKGVCPMRVQKTLFGKKGIQGLDGKVHKSRKNLFMSLLTPEYEKEFLEICQRNLNRYAPRWERMSSIVLYKESQKVLFESVCQWVGISYDKNKVGDYAEGMGLMIYGFGRMGKTYQKGKAARKQAEKWVRSSVIGVREGALIVEESSPLYQISMYEENGEQLDHNVAAVEIINMIRPIIAIATFVTFEALALKHYPECKGELTKRDSMYLEMFCEEVRRFYPFAPFIGAKVKCDFVWKNYIFKKKSLVILDLYGTNHDPKLWTRPNQFRPERFGERKKDLYDFIPQGGGNIRNGHRCAGDVITVKVMEVFADYLVNHLEYDVPKQNLGYSLQKIPTLPKSGFVMKNVKLKKGL